MNDDLINDVIGDEPDAGEDANEEPAADGGEETSGDAGESPQGESEESRGETDEGAKGKAEDGGKSDDGDKPTKVPLGELLEERRRRQALEQQTMELQARLAAQEQLKEEMRQFREQLKAKEDEEEAVPDYEEDPLEHLKAKTERQEQLIQQQMEAQRQAQEQQQAAIQQQEAIKQVVTAISQREAEFVKEAPDYYEAIEHVRSIQRENLSGLGLTPDQVEAEVARAELETGIAALQNGVDPASYVYNIAKRMGYTPKAKDTDNNAGNQDDAKMDALEKGTKAQSVAGGANLKELAEIEDDEEFEAAMKEVFGG